MNFAGINSTYDETKVKIAFKIQNWPFLALSNLLSITMDSGVENNNNGDESCVNGGTDESGNLMWFMIYVGDLSLYLIILFIFIIINSFDLD